MKILILGAGVVGSFNAARLSDSIGQRSQHG
jgi:ketopantoate reductase